METLYCSHCKQTFRVRREDIELMRAHAQAVPKEKERYRYDEGCFFKALTALKRRPHPHD